MKTDNKQGIQRFIAIFCSLALNEYIKLDPHNDAMNNARRENQNKINDKEPPTSFEQIVRWEVSLLGECDEKVD